MTEDQALHQLFGMDVGDVAEVGSLLPAISKEPTIFQVTYVDPDKSVQFAVTFHDVLLCKRTLRRTEQGELKWD